MIELEPFTRLLWKGKKTEELWQPRYNRMRKVYSETEWQTFLQDYRKVYVGHVMPHQLMEFFHNLNEYDLIFIPTTTSRVYDGFSHKHIVPKQGEPYYYYGVIAKRENKNLAEKFAEASQHSHTDHSIIGELLGYPPCCTEWFNKVWAKPSIDPMFEMANMDGDVAEVKVHPYCNQMLRYFGLRITPHLPCSIECEETIEMGKKWIEVMRKIDSEATTWLIEILSMPMTWDCWRGVAIVDSKLFRGVCNSDSPEKRKLIINE